MLRTYFKFMDQLERSSKQFVLKIYANLNVLKQLNREIDIHTRVPIHMQSYSAAVVNNEDESVRKKDEIYKYRIYALEIINVSVNTFNLFS